jgi:hypothetical protein
MYTQGYQLSNLPCGVRRHGIQDVVALRMKAFSTRKGSRCHNLKLLTAGLNIGYKFVTSSGAYFRTGGYIGGGLDFGIIGENVNRLPLTFYFKPDLAVGIVFKPA